VPSNVDPAIVRDTICASCGEWQFRPLVRSKAENPYIASLVTLNYCPEWAPLPPSEVVARRQLRESTSGAGHSTDADPIRETGGQIEETGLSRERLIGELKPSEQKAYYAFEYAVSKTGKSLTDQEAHDLLTEEGIPEGVGDRAVLTDYHLPDFVTWSRQLRTARAKLQEQKYTRRAGRPHGSSIVRGDQIEQQDPGQ
jgi:hypothetical protein